VSERTEEEVSISFFSLDAQTGMPDKLQSVLNIVSKIVFSG
jgi:hypothetical protein